MWMSGRHVGRRGRPLPPPSHVSPNHAAFKNDAHALAASRAELRSKFGEAAGAAGDDAARAVADAHEAADFLRTYVVQAALNERGNYEMRVEKHHVDTVAEEGEIRGPRQG